MPKRTKSRALYILKYLWLYTDDEHPASISDLTAIEDELVEQRNSILSEYAGGNKLVSQLIDLALLANGMLKGEALSQFIKRSVQMIG